MDMKRTLLVTIVGGSFMLASVGSGLAADKSSLAK